MATNYKYIQTITSDYWKVSQKVIPKEKHMISKSELIQLKDTITNVRTSSLPVKTLFSKAKNKKKVLFKKQKILEISIKLFMLKKNNQISIFD